MGALKEAAVVGIAGVAGSKVMDPVLNKLYEKEAKGAREQEERVSPGTPTKVAAEKTLKVVNIEPTDERKKYLSYVFHYGLAASWAPLYLLLRRRLRMDPIGAGTLSGIAMWAVVDEFLTPKLGFSAPNRKYPLEAHTRGFIGHLAFGWSVAAFSELGLKIANRKKS